MRPTFRIIIPRTPARPMIPLRLRRRNVLSAAIEPATANMLVTGSYLVGKYIMYGVFIYSAMNWWYYRNEGKNDDGK
jgi:hypothetical protein